MYTPGRERAGIAKGRPERDCAEHISHGEVGIAWGCGRLVDAALGNRAEREREPAVDGVVEELRRADVERDERGDDAERATGLVERDGVRGGEFSCGCGEARGGNVRAGLRAGNGCGEGAYLRRGGRT